MLGATKDAGSLVAVARAGRTELTADHASTRPRSGKERPVDRYGAVRCPTTNARLAGATEAARPRSNVKHQPVENGRCRCAQDSTDGKRYSAFGDSNLARKAGV